MNNNINKCRKCCQLYKMGVKHICEPTYTLQQAVEKIRNHPRLFILVDNEQDPKGVFHQAYLDWINDKDILALLTKDKT